MLSCLQAAVSLCVCVSTLHLWEWIMCQSGLQVACRAAALQRGGGKAGKVQVPQRLWRRWTEQSQHLRGPFKSLLITLLTPPFHSFFCLSAGASVISLSSLPLLSPIFPIYQLMETNQIYNPIVIRRLVSSFLRIVPESPSCTGEFTRVFIWSGLYVISHILRFY